MWRKLHDDVFEGSMFGAPAEAWLVWFYVVGRTDAGKVALQPSLLAATFSVTPDAIQSGITWLCRPDPNSKIKDHEGRKLVPLGGINYLVPGWDRYQSGCSQEEKRLLWREEKRTQRDKGKARAFPLAESGSGATPAVEPPTPQEVTALEAEFNRVYEAYPKKKRREEALRSFVMTDARNHTSEILDALKWQRQLPDWNKDGGRFIPTLDTYLTDRGWTQKKISRHNTVDKNEPGESAADMKLRVTRWDEKQQKMVTTLE